MHTTKFLILLLTVGIISSFSLNDPEPSVVASGLLHQAFEVNRSIRSVSMTLLAKERIDGQMIQKKTDFKIDYSPFKLYARQHVPKEGLEALYPESRDDHRVLVNWSSISFLKLRLDPNSKTIRKDTHHSIYKAGLAFILSVIEQLQEKYTHPGYTAWEYQGIVKYADIICHKLVFTNPDFHFVDYTFGGDETIEELTTRLKICDYMILEHNPDYKSIEDFKPGTKFKIPSDYAKQIILYLNKETMLPVGVKAFDEKGLFEEYTYLNLKVNPIFKALDFDSENPAYGFN